MSRIVATLKNQLNIMRARDWEQIYIAVDFHGTLIEPDYATFNLENLNLSYYGYAVESLRMLSESSDFKLFTYTASYPDEVAAYVKEMKKEGIKFDFINENPEVRTEEQNWGNFDKKPYFNVLLDDKAGFDPHSDWFDIWFFLKFNCYDLD